MQRNQLTQQQTEALLERAQECTLATCNADSSPYAVPLQYVYHGGMLYIHGKATGQKARNMRRDARVCVSVYESGGLVTPPQPDYMCGINTVYHSAVAHGTAREVTDDTRKEELLRVLVRKYVPDMAELPVKQGTLSRTAVFEITIDTLTGKSYG